MLAITPPQQLVWETEYSGFPFWEVLLCEPGQERRAAERIANICNVTVYWPHYSVSVPNPRKKGHRVGRQKSVLPGVLLSPIELLAIPRRLDVLTYAMVRAVSVGGRRHLKKDEVEVIREISAKLNQGEKDRLALSAFAIGQRVRFVSGLYAAFLGGGTILDIAKSGQVRVKIEGTLFGGQDQIIVPASELEAIESEPPALDAAPPSTQINSRR